MLMVLAVMTYAKLDSYRAQSVVRSELQTYMQQAERLPINQGAEKLYKDMVVNPKGEQDSKAKTSGKISWEPLLYGKTDDPQYMQIFALSRTLIDILCRDEEDYQKIIQERPTFFEEIIARLQRIVEALPEKKKIKSVKELANFTIGDDLQTIFFVMLKGCRTTVQENAEPQAVEDEGAGAQEADDEGESDQDTSLLNYISLNKKPLINVYLAAKPLLIAIYGSPEAAEHVIQIREALYRAHKAGMSAEEASAEFARQAQVSNWNGLLEYKVTLTDPKGR